MQARTDGDGAPPLRSALPYHIAADWEEFADIRAAAKALSQRSRLRNALSIAVNTVSLPWATAPGYLLRRRSVWLTKTMDFPTAGSVKSIHFGQPPAVATHVTRGFTMEIQSFNPGYTGGPTHSGGGGRRGTHPSPAVPASSRPRPFLPTPATEVFRAPSGPLRCAS